MSNVIHGVHGPPRFSSYRDRGKSMNLEWLSTLVIPTRKTFLSRVRCPSWRWSCNTCKEGDFRKSRRFQRIVAISARCGQPRNVLPTVRLGSPYSDKAHGSSNWLCKWFRSMDVGSTGNLGLECRADMVWQPSGIRAALRKAPWNSAEGVWEIGEAQNRAEPAEARPMCSHYHLVRTKHQKGCHQIGSRFRPGACRLTWT